MSDSLYLIDVSALAFRSFYAFINRPLVNSKGEETSAIFGFASHMLRLLQEVKPSHIAFVKDLPKPTFRHEMYDDYKAHRKPMPDGLAKQLPVIDRFVALSGLRTVSSAGYEADDVMATLTCRAKERGMPVYLVTRDKDMMQLVGDGVFLFELGKQGTASALMGPKEVEEKMGVPPRQIVDYLALIGDSSDNVPGVDKVGPKGACELLKEFGDLDTLYASLDKVAKKGLRENLEKGRDSAFLSRKLVTLHCDTPLDLGLDDLCCPDLNREAVKEFLQEWELTSLMRYVIPPPEPVRAPARPAPDAPEAEPEGAGEPADTAAALAAVAAPPEFDRSILHYELVATPEAFDTLITKLKAAPVLAVDTETDGLDTKSNALVGICLSSAPHSGWYVPVGHRDGPNLDLAAVAAALKPVFDDPARTLVFHNAKFDLPVLGRHGLGPAGLDRPGKLVDTMVAAHLAYPGVRQISLDDLALRHFGHPMIPITDLIGKGKKQISFADTPVDKAGEYGAEDADVTFRLWPVYERELREKDLLKLYYEVEMALLPVLIGMEQRGVRVDAEALKAFGEELGSEIKRLEAEIHALAGVEFNVNSPVQLGEILFEKLGLKAGKKTKTGYSTDADVLGKLEGAHPIVSKLLEHREANKLKNTYLEALPGLVNPRTGRVHTTYSQVIAATGRLSSVNPNLQNIPIRTGLGKRIRACFVAGGPEYRLLSADYSQIELRFLAHFSKDPALLDAYRNGVDIHTRTAAALYKVPEAEVTADMRRSAKVVNFGVLYGMGATRLSNQLQIPRAEASRFIENYFSTYADVERFMDATIAEGRRLGYVSTILGRRRYLPELASSNRMHKEVAERVAANTPIQGSAADLIKVAMVNIARRLAKGGLDCHMQLQVHDELVFEVHQDDVEAASRLVKEEMEAALRLEVPLVVEVGAGRTWLEAH